MSNSNRRSGTCHTIFFFLTILLLLRSCICSVSLDVRVVYIQLTSIYGSTCMWQSECVTYLKLSSYRKLSMRVHISYKRAPTHHDYCWDSRYWDRNCWLYGFQNRNNRNHARMIVIFNTGVSIVHWRIILFWKAIHSNLHLCLMLYRMRNTIASSLSPRTRARERERDRCVFTAPVFFPDNCHCFIDSLY